MHKDIMGLLGQMGLKNREGRIYLICLQFKSGLFIHEIAKQTGITRSTVDLTVKRLVARGFLNRVKVGRRFRFFAQAPEAVLFRQKQLVEDWEQVVPLLGKLSGEKKDTEVLFFEGAHGLKQVHDEALLNIKFAKGDKKDILAFSSGADLVHLYPNIQKGFINKRIKNGSWYKAIATADSPKVPELQNHLKSLRAVKYLPKEADPFRIEMQVYADSVMMYSPTNPIGGVIIRNERIAEAVRTLFKQMWNLLPEHMS